MPHPRLDRRRIKFKPLAERRNRQRIERDQVAPDQAPPKFPAAKQALMDEVLARVRAARKAERPVILAFGAHAIKNGLGPVLIRLLEGGWLTHLATNGAGIIHDWEFAFQGETSEDVRAGIGRGEFGLWEETGFYLNLALNAGAYAGQGYGEAVGAMIENDGVTLPATERLENEVTTLVKESPAQAAAAADLLAVMREFELKAGRRDIPHPYKRFSVQAAAWRLGAPFTGHPMFGHDIIYNHPLNHGAALGRVAERDYLTFAESVSHLAGGVFLSLGSAVMAPMIFEKAFALAQNLALQAGRPITDHFILAVDLAESNWDWSRGEPPENDPAYYLRFNKTFNRMGGSCRYLQADNRDFLPALLQGLEG